MASQAIYFNFNRLRAQKNALNVALGLLWVNMECVVWAL